MINLHLRLFLTAAVLLAAEGATRADEGLIGHWVFDKQHIEGQTVRDLAGKSPATVSGTVRLERTGQVESLVLDGVSGSVSVAEDFHKAAVPKKDMTAEAWVRVDKPQEWGGIVGAFQDNGPYERGWVLGFSGMKFTFGLKGATGVRGTSGPNAINYLAAGTPFRRGEWYHVVGTYDGTNHCIYVNGKLEASEKAPGGLAQSGDIDYPPAAYYTIGAYRDQDEFFRMGGAVHEVRVYNRALSADEVKRRHDEYASRLPQTSRLRLASVFGNHGVLQRDMPLPVWGVAAPGEHLTVTFADARAEADADAQGKWKTTLPPQKAGGPHKLLVAGKTDRLTVEDVLVGEVWLCSGQSNMQFGLNSSNTGAKDIPAAKFPEIRLFTVPNVMTPQPVADCDAGWDVCSPQTVATFSAVGFYFGRELHRELKVPVGLINSSWGGSECEAWMSREALAADPDYAQILARAKGNLGHGTGMYNAMIHPLIPFGIRGAIWYQGEGNCLRAEQYRKLFPALIGDWRGRWGEGDFPFYYVQLAPFARHQYEWPELWEAQFKTLAVPNTGMAVITDIGNIHNIHPPNKQDVGRRLALWALAKTYGREEIEYSGPLYKSAEVEGDKMRVRFDHSGGLASRDGKPLTWFMIAGKDRKFQPAQAEIEKDTASREPTGLPTVVVHSPAVKEPVAVHFGWDCSAEPNLMNKAGLPASPFRTDDWPGVTAGRK